MNFPIHVESKLINPGFGNDSYPYCISFTYFQGQQYIAYGSANRVIIVSNNLSIIASLCKHKPGTFVTAVAWAQYSGKLTSCGTDLALHIWQPISNGWECISTFSIPHIANCISWNYCDTKFCIASKTFAVYNVENIDKNNNHLIPVFVSSTPTEYCQYSRDSRFILTLQKNKKHNYIWYMGNRGEYRRIVLEHPSAVKSISWRLSEDIYERCSIMSLTENGLVRIWTETSVNERFNFNLVAVIPGVYIAGCFLITTSKMITTNPSFYLRKKNRYKDSYANGNGHLLIRDQNCRFSRTPNPNEISRNRSLLLLLDKNSKMSIWELTGFSLWIRNTPTITKLGNVDLYNIQPYRTHHFLPDCIYFIATYSRDCQLTSSVNVDLNKNRASIISLILLNKNTHTIRTVDITMENQNSTLTVLGVLKGHRYPIKFFRIHHTKQYMISIDESQAAILWKIDDTDVFDPTVLISFICSIDSKMMVADFINETNQILGYDGKSLLLYNIDFSQSSSPALSPISTLYCPIKFESPILDFVVIRNNVFLALFAHSLYVCKFIDKKVSIIEKFSSNVPFIGGSKNYFSQISILSGIHCYVVATKESVSIIHLTPDNSSISIKEIFEIHNNEFLVSINHSKPGSIYIISNKNIYVGRLFSGEEFEILEVFPLEHDSDPLFSSCLSNGFLAVAFRDEIQLFFHGRKSHEFTKSLLTLNLVGKCPANNISAIIWSTNGIFMYTSECQIFALTTFMDTFFLDSDIKLPTIHHSLVRLNLSVPDIHPTVLGPLIISGRYNLISKMIKYFYTHFHEVDCRLVFKKYILVMPPEIDKQGSHLISKKITEYLNQLIDLIREEQETISLKQIENFKQTNSVDNALQTLKEENSNLLHILSNLENLLNVSFDILDERSLVFYRTFLLSKNVFIPFDIICCAEMSFEKDKLIQLMNIDTWDKVRISGLVFWCEKSQLEEILIPIALHEFNSNRNLSIFLLVLMKRFKALQHLYTTIGDDTRAAFFVRDFSNSHNKKSAQKNSYSALSNHNYLVAAAIFTLANDWTTALSICHSTLNDYTISYLLTLFCPDKNLYSNYLINGLMKRSKDMNDLAALALFEHISYNKPIDLSNRMKQAQPGFFHPEMQIFGDVRFCVCEVLKSDVGLIRDLLNSLILSGHFFLGLQYLTYLNYQETQQEKDDGLFSMKTSQSLQSISRNQIDSSYIPRRPSNEFVKNSLPYSQSKLTEKSKRRHHKKRHRKQKPFLSVDNLLNCSSSLIFDFDDDDDSNSDQMVYQFKLNSNDTFTSTNENESKSTENEKELELNKNESNSNEKELNGNKYESINSIIRSPELPSTENDNSLSPESKSIENEHESMSIKSEVKSFEDESELKSHENDDSLIDKKVDSCDFYNCNSDYCNKLAAFNITRLRFETILGQKLSPTEIEEIIPKLGQEIDKSKNSIGSLQKRVLDFLLNSCKRCSFIYRRLLLDRSSQFTYIISLCDSLSNLPNLTTSHILTSQQIAQISLTLYCLISYINKNPIQQYSQSRYIIAAIAIGLFVVACNTLNADLLLSLFQLNLKSLKSFPQSILNLINVKMVGPELVVSITSRYERKRGVIDLIAPPPLEIFSYGSIDKTALNQFMSPLLNIMLIDEILNQIELLEMNNQDFRKLFLSLRKLLDLSAQLYIYTTLNFPVIADIPSLHDVSVSDEKIRNLYHFLLQRNNREKRVSALANDILIRYADFSPCSHVYKLRNVHRIAHFKGGIISFCIINNIITAATSQGLKLLNLKEKQIIEPENEDENESFFDDDPDVEVEEQPSIVQDDVLETNKVYSDFSPSFKPIKFRSLKRPRLVNSHPTEPYIIIGDYYGNLYAQHIFNNDIATFSTEFNTKVTALSIQQSGTMFAAAQSKYVSLFSFCQHSCDRPFARFDTHGSYVQALTFAQGSGIFATCQMPSPYFDANVVFWDSILPPGNAMITSFTVEQIGHPVSICFCPKLYEVVIGTGKGSLVIIDTRKYEIMKVLKAHEKGIYAVNIDQEDRYCFSGGGEGAVKIWDMNTFENVGHINNVHTTKNVKSRQKWRSIAITDIEIRDRLVYTCGLDGNINCIEFS